MLVLADRGYPKDTILVPRLCSGCSHPLFHNEGGGAVRADECFLVDSRAYHSDCYRKIASARQCELDLRGITERVRTRSGNERAVEALKSGMDAA